MARLTHEPIQPAALIDAVRRPDCGGVVLFLGTVRDITAGQATSSLDYEAYPGMAEKKLAEVEAEMLSRWPMIGAVSILHRLGHLEIGEIAVGVAVACPHRGEAFAACEFAIGRLKKCVPIWKKDNRPDGTSEWHDHA